MRTSRAPGALRAALLAGALLVAGAGCSDDEGEGGAAPAPAVPSAPAPSAPATAPAPPAAPAPLPRDCAGLVPAGRLVEALARPLPGPGAVVRQGPEPGAGRTGRTTCTYGAAPAGGVAPLQVALAAYEDAAAAAGRVDATVERAAGRGDAVAPQPVAGVGGFLVTGAAASSLVLARGPETLVVTLARRVVPPAAVRPALVEVAAAVLAARPAPPAPDPASATSTP